MFDVFKSHESEESVRICLKYVEICYTISIGRNKKAYILRLLKRGMIMTPRLLSILIGYCFGNLLTAELVAKHFAGKSSSEIGSTGNPGMANIMVHLGFKEGLLVLLGDISKCILAIVICRLLFRGTGRIVTLYAGLGCTLGHDFPCWRKFRGGKGVATSSTAITLYAPLWSLVAHIVGIIITLATKYLCIAGIAVPLVFGICMVILRNWEAAILSGVFTLLAVFCNRTSLLGIRNGTTEQTDILGKLRKKKVSKK